MHLNHMRIYFKMKKTKYLRGLSLAKTKVQRGYSYIAAVMLPFLVARSLEDMFPNWSWWYFFIPSLILIWVLGEIDWKSGLYANELEFAFTKNPEWENMKQNMKENTK